MAQSSLDKFGKLVIRNLRDSGLEFFDGLTQGRWKAPELSDLQAELGKLAQRERDIVRCCVDRVLSTAMHDFLFALVESHHRNGNIDVVIDGKSVIEESDGLDGEPYGEEGWIARFSKYKRLVLGQGQKFGLA